MARTTTAGYTRKSHKSLKTVPNPALDGGPSSNALTTTEPPAPSAFRADNPEGEPEAVPAEVPRKQWWIRRPDSKIRAVVAKIMVMRAAGHKDAHIAKKLHTTDATVQNYVYIGRKNGWLDEDDAPVDLELELALSVDRKVVRNVGAALDGQMTNWQTHEMTIAAAKGRGIFKNHDVVKAEGGSGMAMVAIQVVMPPVGAGDQLPEVREDQMGGAPAFLDGETLDDAYVDPRQAVQAGHPAAESEEGVDAQS